MLRLTDSRTGGEVVFDRPVGGFVSIEVRVRSVERTSPIQLRALILADVLRRILEDLHGLQVVTSIRSVTDSAGETGEWRDVLSKLWIPVPPPDPGVSLGRLSRLEVEADGADPTARDGSREGVLLVTGPVDRADGAGRDAVGADDLLAFRLAVLAVPYQERLVLDAAELSRAAATLDRWRSWVAEWADHPSSPIPRDTAHQVYGALADNVDVAGVFAILERLSGDPAVSDGAKFETFVHVDRILGLDLPRYLGSSR